MAIIIFFIAHWYLSLFSQTFFLHRYSAHKMFTMNKFWERFFYMFTYITQGSSYLSPRGYAILHRMHHAYSDTELDPHSPHHSNNLFDMMWKTKKMYSDFAHERVEVPVQFDKNYPVWNFVERLGESWGSRIAWGTAYVLFYVAFVPASMWYLYLLLPIHFLMGPVHGAIVNWAGHMYGYQNFDNQDKSKNSLVLDFLMMGELFQNNHHKLPKRMNFAVKWWELDPTYPVIKVLSWMRIIRPQTATAGQVTGDFRQAV
ncbi:acyl-CoA desaturase [Catalinimonas alkaloidigena]|nr:acyl-CoA desaturase [Catalinimonas alkaloidigena]